MHEIKSSGAIFIIIKSVFIADIETLTGSTKIRLITLSYFVYFKESNVPISTEASHFCSTLCII